MTQHRVPAREARLKPAGVLRPGLLIRNPHILLRVWIFEGPDGQVFDGFGWFGGVPDGPGHSRKVGEGPGQKLKKVEK